MEILKHKDTIDELVASGDEIMKTSTEEEKQTMKVIWQYFSLVEMFLSFKLKTSQGNSQELRTINNVLWVRNLKVQPLAPIFISTIKGFYPIK